jgi:hypothetical protein
MCRYIRIYERYYGSEGVKEPTLISKPKLVVEKRSIDA